MTGPRWSRRAFLAAGAGAVGAVAVGAGSGTVSPLGDPVLTAPGTGPRHLAHHPYLPAFYLVDELSSQVTVYHTTGRVPWRPRGRACRRCRPTSAGNPPPPRS
ncbi:beta-propeller fold lactonase family protein [Rhodococcus sp. NPDC056960]|uniref:beta-propeller fold lactonase family protein n=1 Tax=Rhodococcus sp. NPDC056960 TaxID=3345982 RepID=UPI00362FC729